MFTWLMNKNDASKSLLQASPIPHWNLRSRPSLSSLHALPPWTKVVFFNEIMLHKKQQLVFVEIKE